MDKVCRDDAIARLLQRVDATLLQTPDGFPHFADPADGVWVRTPTGDWTGGFWCGLLWLAALHTGETRYRDEALTYARRLGSRADSQSVFKGFLFWYGAGLGSKLLDDAVATELCERGTRGLTDMYSPGAGLIALGKEAEEASDTGVNEANIDALPGTIALLLDGDRESKTYAMGMSHIRRHVALCVRDDGSVCQSATFNPADGSLSRRYTHKGFSADSTWARAQAWCLIGLAQAIERGMEELKPVAIKVGDWWIDHVPADLVAYWDFDAGTAPDTPRDTSATAIAAAAFLKLARLIPERQRVFQTVAEKTVSRLVSDYLTPVGGATSDAREPGILTGGCFDKRRGVGTEHELIWGDYFLLEALLGLAGVLAPERI